MRVAILDMYNGVANQGMRGITQLIRSEQMEYDIFDVRGAAIFPDIQQYDIYISTGGPGAPLEPDSAWQQQYFEFIESLDAQNRSGKGNKKYVFFICHSFQLACHLFGLAEVKKRKSNSFGVFPIHKAPSGMKEPILKDLPDKYWGVDSRDYQVVQPNLRVFRSKGAKILSLEKIRNHVELERAIMAVRFSPQMIGTQFHPEADPESFTEHLKDKTKRKAVIELIGRTKFYQMLEYLLDEEKVLLTFRTIIPTFLRDARDKLNSELAAKVHISQ